MRRCIDWPQIACGLGFIGRAIGAAGVVYFVMFLMGVV